MFRITAAALAAGLALAAAPATAATYNLITIGELTAVFQSAGVSVSSTSKSDVLRVGNSFVWLTDCRSDGRCAEINLFNNYADVRPTLAAVNQWNNTKKIPEASVNADGTLHMEMWISAIGVTDTNIIDTFGWFQRYSADTDYWGPYMAGV